MDFGHNIRKYFPFTRVEIKSLIITVFVIAFLVSFRSWGAEEFNVLEGILNLISAFLIVLLSMFAHIALQRIYSYKLGYVARYENFPYGLMGGVVLGFASSGNLYFIAPGHVTIQHMPRLRLGEFRYGLNLWEYAKISFSGPIANLLLAMFFKIFSFLGNPLIDQAVTINLLLAIFSMVPLPKTDGLDIFRASRIFYVFGLILIIVSSAALFLLQGVLLWITTGIFFAVIAATLYFIFVDEGLG